jgi:bacillopeptidase F (M6 metalloprotease family)
MRWGNLEEGQRESSIRSLNSWGGQKKSSSGRTGFSVWEKEWFEKTLLKEWIWNP